MIEGHAGGDTIDGGAGSDTVTYVNSNAGVTVNLATGEGSGGDANRDVISNVENATGSGHDDTLEGDSGANTLDGGGGGDTLTGGGGADSLNGGTGTDTR